MKDTTADTMKFHKPMKFESKQNLESLFDHTYVSSEFDESNEPVNSVLLIEKYFNQHYNEVLEGVKNEFNNQLVPIYNIIDNLVDEIKTLKSPIEQEDLFHSITYLKNCVVQSSLPNPEIYLKEIDSQIIINIVIDDSENYLDYLDIYSDIVNDIYLKYDLDLEILLFEKNEIENPFSEQGFNKIKL